jgi:hypothetical protein
MKNLEEIEELTHKKRIKKIENIISKAIMQFEEFAFIPRIILDSATIDELEKSGYNIERNESGRVEVQEDKFLIRLKYFNKEDDYSDL